MREDGIVAELAQEHPGANVVRLPPGAPTEIVCELHTAAESPEYGRAIAVIEKSAAHFHRRTHETYRVLKGSGILHLDETKLPLSPGDVADIEPGRVHWVEGEEVWLVVESRPAWTPEDHIIVEPDSL